MLYNNFMNNLSRLIHFDFHNVVGIKNFAKNFDEKDFAKALKNACVTHVNFFASCNNGYCYFPTKVGIPYPTLKKDLLGKVIDACHKQDIKVNAYIHLGLNHAQALKHPEWTKEQSVGCERYVSESDKKPNMRFTNFMCYNRKGYKDYVKELVKEVLTYQVDGLFFDGFYPEDCRCNVCENLMAEQNIDVKDQESVLQFQTQKMLDFANGLKAIIPENLPIVFNGFPPEYKLNSHYEYEGGLTDFYKTKYLSNLYENGVFMTGRFCQGWGDYGGIKNTAEFEYDLFNSLAGCTTFAFGDHLHPYDANYELLNQIGEVFNRHKSYEGFIKNQKSISEVGVLCNNFKHLSLDTYVGVTTILSELHLQYSIINETCEFDSYSLLILPDDICLSKSLINKLNAYTKNGGKILSTGFAGFNKDNLSMVLECQKFIKDVVLDDNSRGYFKFEEPFGVYKNTPFSIYCPAVKIKGKGEKLASYVEPMFKQNEQEVSGVFYNPQGEESKFSVVLCSKDSAHICFKIFKSYAQNALPMHKELLKRTINNLLTETIIKTNLPSPTKTLVTRSNEHTLLHVIATHPIYKNGKAIIEEHTFLKQGYVLEVKGEYKNACTLPDETMLQTVYDNGYTKIILPEVTGYLMIKLS